MTFFILTYRPAPTEGQFSMKSPARGSRHHAAITKEQPKEQTTTSVDAELRTLKTVLTAGDGGKIGGITLADKPIHGMDELRKELEGFVNDPLVAFDQAALIKVDPQPASIPS